MNLDDLDIVEFLSAVDKHVLPSFHIDERRARRAAVKEGKLATISNYLVCSYYVTMTEVEAVRDLLVELGLETPNGHWTKKAEELVYKKS